MVDLIFVVSDPQQWHAINVRQFPEHYSAVRFLGSRAIAAIEDWGAHVYFNTLVSMNDLVGCFLNREALTNFLLL